MGFEDHLKRKLILKEKNFKKHTKGYYVNEFEQRDKLFPFVKDVLSKPDEIWIHTHNKAVSLFHKKYIKFYKNETITVETQLDDNKLEIKTWYKLRGDEMDKRKGLLIHNSPLVKSND